MQQPNIINVVPCSSGDHIASILCDVLDQHHTLNFVVDCDENEWQKRLQWGTVLVFKNCRKMSQLKALWQSSRQLNHVLPDELFYLSDLPFHQLSEEHQVIYSINSASVVDFNRLVPLTSLNEDDIRDNLTYYLDYLLEIPTNA